jgi:hypothetical protein
MKKITIAIMTAMLAISINPLSAMAADPQHYELIGWSSNATGIQFIYEGPMGTGHAELPCGEIMYPHGKDPSWIDIDSAAPILAYIKKYGITSAIKESMNPTCFDPSVLKALSAQGVSLTQLGGPSSPVVGQNYEETHYPSSLKLLVGVNIPTPDLSNLTSTPTPKAVSNPTPSPAPMQSKQPQTQQATQATAVNPPIPNANATDQNPTQPNSNLQSQAKPQTTEPKATIPTSKTQVASATPTGPVIPPKVVPPALQKQTKTPTKTSNWKTWLLGGIAAIIILGAGVFGFLKSTTLERIRRHDRKLT